MNSEDKKSTNEKLLFVYSKGNVYGNARFEEIRQFIWMRTRALFAMGMLLDAKIFSAISANTITKVRFFYEWVHVCIINIVIVFKQFAWAKLSDLLKPKLRIICFVNLLLL